MKGIREYLEKKEKTFESVYALFRGNIVTLYGDSGTFKTTFVANLAGWLVRKKINVAIIDTEGSMSQTFTGLPIKRIEPSFENLLAAIAETKTDVLIIDSIGIVSNRFFALRSVVEKEPIKAAREVAVNIQAVYARLFDMLNRGDVKTVIVINQPVSVLGVTSNGKQSGEQYQIPPMLGDKADFYSKERYYFKGRRVVYVIAERSEKFPYGSLIMTLTREGKKINITLKHQL